MSVFDAMNNTARRDLIEFYTAYYMNYYDDVTMRNRARTLYTSMVDLIEHFDDDLNEPICRLLTFYAYTDKLEKPTKTQSIRMLMKCLRAQMEE